MNSERRGCRPKCHSDQEIFCPSSGATRTLKTEVYILHNALLSLWKLRWVIATFVVNTTGVDKNKVTDLMKEKRNFQEH